MRSAACRRARNWPEIAISISVGRFRPVAVIGALAAEFRGRSLQLAESGQFGAPGRTRTCDPRLRRPSVHALKTGLNSRIPSRRPVIAGGYVQRAAIWPPARMWARIPELSDELESEAITERRGPIEFAPDFARTPAP